MGKTIKGSKGCGYDYNGKRPLSGNCGHGADVKRRTHKLERRIAARLIRGRVVYEPDFTFTCSRCGDLGTEEDRAGKTGECIWCYW